jgi:hypothetical protein
LQSVLPLWLFKSVARKHTLSQYRIMQHAKSSAYSFYYSPYDILWFSLDFRNEPFGEETQRRQLNIMASKSTLLQQSLWGIVWASDMKTGCLRCLPDDIALLHGL